MSNDVTFTKDDIQTFQDMVDNQVFYLGRGVDLTERKRGDHTVEVSFDRKGKHLALVEMVAHRDYSRITAPIEAIVTRRYTFNDRHGEYQLHGEITRKIENK